MTHCLAESPTIILSTVQRFSICKVFIDNQSSTVSGAMQVMTCEHFFL